jgi:CRP/FNR family transcriptional regulator, cyclic AMP receptor protein
MPMARFRLRRDRRVTSLRKIRLFSGCTNEELRSIASLHTQYDARQSDILAEQGRPGRECFVIVEGTATMSRDNVTLADLGPGDLVGELAVLDGGPQMATVVARTDMRLLVFSRREFLHLCGSFPTVSFKVLTGLVARLRGADTALDGLPAVDTSVLELV